MANVEYFVEVGSCGFGYEHRCSDLASARACYRYEKGCGVEVTLYKYNYDTCKKTVINHCNG